MRNSDKNTPAQEDESQACNDRILFAPGGAQEIDEDILNQIKAFAQFARENRA